MSCKNFANNLFARTQSHGDLFMHKTWPPAHPSAHRNYAHFRFCGFLEYEILVGEPTCSRSVANFGCCLFLLSSVNVNLTKSFCILSTNELLKRRQGNNNNKRLKSGATTRGGENGIQGGGKHQKRSITVGIVCGQSWKLHKLRTEQLKQ